MGEEINIEEQTKKKKCKKRKKQNKHEYISSVIRTVTEYGADLPSKEYR